MTGSLFQKRGCTPKLIRRLRDNNLVHLVNRVTDILRIVIHRISATTSKKNRRKQQQGKSLVELEMKKFWLLLPMKIEVKTKKIALEEKPRALHSKGGSIVGIIRVLPCFGSQIGLSISLSLQHLVQDTVVSCFPSALWTSMNER